MLSGDSPLNHPENLSRSAHFFPPFKYECLPYVGLTSLLPAPARTTFETDMQEVTGLLARLKPSLLPTTTSLAPTLSKPNLSSPDQGSFPRSLLSN